LTSIKSSAFFSGLKNIKNLAKENEDLEKKVLELQVENSRLKEVELTNQKLRQQLGLKEKMKDLELVSAEVVSFGGGTISAEIWLNRGKKDGISLGAAVISNRCLLGKITELESDFSKVTLITDPSSVVNVILQDKRATGVVKGKVGFNLVMESIPPGIELKPGERIITSGLGETLPRGLIVGEIEKVTSSKSDLFQTAEIKSPLDFSLLELVFVIKSSGEK